MEVMDDGSVDRFKEYFHRFNINKCSEIELLTKLAAKAAKHADQIVEIIVGANNKSSMAKLCLADSIVRNADAKYKCLLGKKIVDLFINTFEEASNQKRKKLLDLRGSWNDVWPVSVLRQLDLDISNHNDADLDEMELELYTNLKKENIPTLLQLSKNVFIPSSKNKRKKEQIISDLLKVPTEPAMLSDKDLQQKCVQFLGGMKYATNGKKTLVELIQAEIKTFTGCKRPLMVRSVWLNYVSRSLEWLLEKKKAEQPNRCIHFEYSVIYTKVKKRNMARHQLVEANTKLEELSSDPQGAFIDIQKLRNEIKSQLEKIENSTSEDDEEEDEY